MNQVIIPENYHSVLSMYETQDAIGIIKEMMQKKLCMALRLKRVTAPLFVDPASGLNDDLNGVERPVSFEIPAAGVEAQVVHSLAKWKRMALYRYDFRVGKGILTDMNAIRRDEELDNLHSCYVDQWDWEKVIDRSDRNEDYLKAVVKRIVGVICNTLDELKYYYPQLELELNRDVAFVTTQELEDRYPDLTPKQRENVFVKEHGTAFIMKIGDKLKSGEPHDGRAPDYDDWALNADIVVYYPVLDIALELSSMGIRVDKKALLDQLQKAGCPERAELPYHKAVIDGELPLTIGGGIGQSRICMFFLRKAHIGEVQCSLWSDEVMETAKENGLQLL